MAVRGTATNVHCEMVLWETFGCEREVKVQTVVAVLRMVSTCHSPCVVHVVGLCHKCSSGLPCIRSNLFYITCKISPVVI